MTTYCLLFRGYFSDSIIEVSKTKQIPGDYYGCIGVPITALDKISNAPDSPWEILDMIRPQIHGKLLYCRYVIRKKLPPEIEAYMDSGGVFYKTDCDLYIPLDGEPEKIELVKRRKYEEGKDKNTYFHNPAGSSR